MIVGDGTGVGVGVGDGLSVASGMGVGLGPVAGVGVAVGKDAAWGWAPASLPRWGIRPAASGVACATPVGSGVNTAIRTSSEGVGVAAIREIATRRTTVGPQADAVTRHDKSDNDNRSPSDGGTVAVAPHRVF